MKIMIVVGARPNFMKAAPIIAAIKERNEMTLPRSANNLSSIAPDPITYTLLHTGQHYGEAMSSAFFADLNLPKPDVHLDVGSGSHAAQTAEIMARFEGVLLTERPNVLVVVGDVNSTLACALVTAKISFDASGTRPLIAHVEAGLRSFDRTMPEEVNRVLTDHLSDLLFVTEPSGLSNLEREGIAAEKIHFVGNTMIDSLLTFKEKAEESTILDKQGLRQRDSQNGSIRTVIPYALLTLHRPSNVDNRDAFLNILGGLKDLTLKFPVIFPVHPRTQKKINDFGFHEPLATNHDSGLSDGKTRPGIRMIEPLGYLDFLCVMKHAALVVTDSGGVQEETTCLGVPCITVRENTERPVTVTCGTNIIAGVEKEGIREAIKRQVHTPLKGAVPEKWDGRAAQRIVEIISDTVGKGIATTAVGVDPAHSSAVSQPARSGS